MRTNGDEISFVRIEHVWVEAYVPYENYRGSGSLSGSREWISLDASFKYYEEADTLDMEKIAGIYREELEGPLYTPYGETDNGVTLFEAPGIEWMLNYANENIEGYVNENEITDEELLKFIPRSRIEKEELGLLPASLPYDVNAISESFYTVPVEMKADISFGFYESLMGVNLASEEIKTVNFDVTDLYGKRVSIYYTPATQEDEEIVKAYGGIYNTPSYLVRVAPRLAIDGETVLTGPEVMPGTHTGFSMVINQPGSSETKVDNPLVAGGNYAVSFDYGMISVPQLERDVERMKELSDTYKIENMFEDSVMGEVLSEIGTLYFAKNDVYNRYISMATGVRAERQICEAMLGSKPRVTYLFGVPVRLGVGTFYIDVDTDVSGVASVKANNNDEVSYMALSGMIGSAMEGAIFEEITGIPSVSTMTVLRKANNRGIGIVCIDKSNAELIDSIETDEASRSEMKRAVKKGNIVIAPEKEICYYEWEGSGYISLDCKTGAGAYMISGSICGGSEALKSDLFLYSNMFLAMGDVAAATALSLAAATPMGFMAGCLLFTLAYVATIESISLIALYQYTGDDAYIRQAAINTLINVAAISAGIIIGQAAKTIGKLIGSHVDDVVDGVRPGIRPVGPGDGGAGGPGGALLPEDILKEIIEKYGDDVADAISKHGKKGTQLYEEFGDDFAQAVKNLGDADDVIRLTDDYAGRADEVLDVINRYGDDAIRLVDDYGDEFLDHASSMDDLDEIKRVLGGGSYVIKNNLVNKVKDIRAKMPNTNLSKRGNMAVADVDIPGIKDNFVAHSRINTELDKGADVADFSYLKPENERIFTSYVDDQYPRYHDTEAKILEDIASQITDPNVSGIINLYSELPCCQSCSNIILEFRRMFPNIELNIFVE